MEQHIDWRDCQHHFIPYFGPVMHCRYCNASTIASVDGKSKPIYPPTDYGRIEKETE